ncbi:hypothetical protein HOG98_07360 [bacterium]|jgi:hypothetical protein|nr:hypothetical protein [bacterium]
MIKNVKLTCLILSAVLLATSVQAKIRYELEDFLTESNAFRAQYIGVEENGETLNFFNVGLSPDFDLGPLGVGLDLNLYLPIQSDKPYPTDFNSVVLRRLKYDHNNQMGFDWGWLKDVTLGYGLIVNDFDTDTGETTQFSNDKAGVLAYGTVSPIRVDALWTMQNVYAGRITYAMDNSPILGSPVIFGGTYITDSDGASTSDGRTTTRPIESAAGVDVGLPIGGDFFTVFAEYGKLIGEDVEIGDAPAGLSVGFQGEFFTQVEYGFEYRNLEAGFIPGYFDNTYESTSYSGTEYTSDTNGLLLRIGSEFMDYFKGGLEWESYEGQDPLLTAAIGWKKINNIAGVVNYTVPYQGAANALLELDAYYAPGGTFTYIINYQRQYITEDTFTESTSVGLQMNVASLFPF